MYPVLQGEKKENLFLLRNRLIRYFFLHHQTKRASWCACQSSDHRDGTSSPALFCFFFSFFLVVAKYSDPLSWTSFECHILVTDEHPKLMFRVQLTSPPNIFGFAPLLHCGSHFPTKCLRFLRVLFWNPLLQRCNKEKKKKEKKKPVKPGNQFHN